MKRSVQAGIALLALTAGAFPTAADTPAAPLPARNWALPLFTNDGYHSMTLRGSEVHPVNSDRIDVVDINITVFSGDAAARVETILLSAAASFFPRENSARGDQSVRVIHFADDGGIAAEITGEQWTYEATGKKVSIRRNAHVVFPGQLTDMLR